MPVKSLKKFVYLSIAAAASTISLKLIAYFLTDSVGLLSDALESCVNFVAAVIALYMLNLAEKPADEEHSFGHGKAEYFSSAIEGGLILIAAFSIFWSAVPRLFNPKTIENPGMGLLVASGASVINFIVATILIRTGRKNNSITLEADGKHLMTDVITSLGVLLGIIIVKFTNLVILDPIVAICVALNIIWTGFKLMQRSASGLLDTSLPKDEREKIIYILEKLEKDNIKFHSLLTRQSGQRKFISFHLLVPGNWTVQKGHDYLDVIEKDIRNLFNGMQVTVFTHIEPIEDPASMLDISIEQNIPGN